MVQPPPIPISIDPSHHRRIRPSKRCRRLWLRKPTQRRSRPVYRNQESPSRYGIALSSTLLAWSLTTTVYSCAGMRSSWMSRRSIEKRKTVRCGRKKSLSYNVKYWSVCSTRGMPEECCLGQSWREYRRKGRSSANRATPYLRLCTR